MYESCHRKVENTMGKGEFARYEQFLLVPQCFQKVSNLRKMPESCHKGQKNTVGKGEIARYEQFLLFPQCFKKVCTFDT